MTLCEGVTVALGIWNYERIKWYSHSLSRESLSLDGPFTTSYLHPHPTSIPGCAPADAPGLSIGECVTLLKGYAVSRTARDCSIMVTLQPADNQEIRSVFDEWLYKALVYNISCQIICDTVKPRLEAHPCLLPIEVKKKNSLIYIHQHQRLSLGNLINI